MADSLSLVLEDVILKAGNIDIILKKGNSSSQDSSVENRHPALTYAAFKAATKSGFRGPKDGMAAVLIYEDKTEGRHKASVKVLNAQKQELGSLWLSKNLVATLVGKHQDELGQWVDTFKTHPSGNATVLVPVEELRIYGLRNKDTKEEWSTIGSKGEAMGIA